MADQGADATPAQALIATWRNAPKVFTGTGIPLPSDTDPERESDFSRIRRATKLECADELEAALAVSPQACMNCGHTNPHNGPAGDVHDACTHPMCNCGFYQPAAVPPQGWQPIETLNGDHWLGRSILVWEPVHRCSYTVAKMTDGRFAIFGASYDEVLLKSPSHWMPLPAPPRVAAGPEEP